MSDKTEIDKKIKELLIDINNLTNSVLALRSKGLDNNDISRGLRGLLTEKQNELDMLKEKRKRMKNSPLKLSPLWSQVVQPVPWLFRQRVFDKTMKILLKKGDHEAIQRLEQQFPKEAAKWKQKQEARRR